MVKLLSSSNTVNLFKTFSSPLAAISFDRMSLLILITIFILFLLRVVVVWREARRARAERRWPRARPKEQGTPPPIKTLVVLGSGGHTTEMLALIDPLQSSSSRYHFVYCKANTDSTSARRLDAILSQYKSSNMTTQNSVVVYDIPRSREVGQSYITSLYTTLYAFGWSLWLVLVEVRPDVLLCNGPGTCLPLAVAVAVGRLTGLLRDCPVVFVESLCRVQTLSLTGRLLYPWADFFAVHWTELHQKYPMSTRCSGFIRDDAERAQANE